MRIENPATVTLFVDDSAEAVQARQALDENKIDYRVPLRTVRRSRGLKSTASITGVFSKSSPWP